MGDFFHRNIIEPGKLPLLLCLGAFILTFVGTRAITRMIRAGVGPFHDNTSGTGLHVHHVVPGIVLLFLGAMIAIGGPPDPPFREIAGVLVGAGAALVLDEFALVLHLEDVYWKEEGRLSVEMVGLATAVMGFMLVGMSPLGVDGMTQGEVVVRLVGVATVLMNFAAVGVALRKGKRGLALIGVFVPVIAWAAALRLAEPNSTWARRRYDEHKRERARVRHEELDRRYGSLLRRVSDLVAGKMRGRGGR